MLRVGGGGGSYNLMLILNLLKSKIPMLRMGGWGSSWNLMLSSNLLKSEISMLRVGRGGQNLKLSSTLLKIQNSHVGGGGGTRRI